MADAAPEPAGSKSEILLYQTEDKRTQIDVRLEGETVWLNQGQMVELFQTTKQNISLHIRNIFEEGELQETAVVKEYLTTAADGKRYSVQHYNLDVIISVGYRVKSHRGTQFRIWATQRLEKCSGRGNPQERCEYRQKLSGRGGDAAIEPYRGSIPILCRVAGDAKKAHAYG
jgi:hypothetical protein